MAIKISSLDPGYSLGDLSVFPLAYDSKEDLYVATNNAETILTHALPYSGKRILVEDTSSFPDNGLLRIGTAPGEVGTHEIIYYGEKRDNSFTDLIRGFNGTRRNRWPARTPITSGVMAEHHNILRDTILNIEANLGVKTNPAEDSLNDLLINLEEKWLAPRPLFRAAPKLIGPPPLTVRFQNFTLAHAVRFLWDFGDGATSTERSPTHTYHNEGHYSIRLDIITQQGGTGFQTKHGYIIVDEEQVTPYFYIVADESTPGNLSIETAAKEGKLPTKFHFIDQTDGAIAQRYWIFGDTTSEQVDDPNNHVTTHYFEQPGEYDPSILVIFESTLLKRGFAEDKLIVR